MTRALVLILLLAGVTALGVTAREAMHARVQLDTSRTNLDSIERAVAEVTRLRALPVAAALEKRPEPGIVGHLTTSLAAAGLPSSLMTSFNPGSDAPYVCRIARRIQEHPARPSASTTSRRPASRSNRSRFPSSDGSSRVGRSSIPNGRARRSR